MLLRGGDAGLLDSHTSSLFDFSFISCSFGPSRNRDDPLPSPGPCSGPTQRHHTNVWLCSLPKEAGLKSNIIIIIMPVYLNSTIVLWSTPEMAYIPPDLAHGWTAMCTVYGVYRRGLICTRTRWIDHPLFHLVLRSRWILETTIDGIIASPCYLYSVQRTLTPYKTLSHSPNHSRLCRDSEYYFPNPRNQTGFIMSYYHTPPRYRYSPQTFLNLQEPFPGPVPRTSDVCFPSLLLRSSTYLSK